MNNRDRYNQLLALPEWRVFSWRCKQQAGFRCAFCEVKGEDKLETHHWWYVAGSHPWEVEQGQVCVMCHACHESLHQSWETLKRYLLTQMGETSEARIFLRLFRRWLFRGFTPEAFTAFNGRLVLGDSAGTGPMAGQSTRIVAQVLDISNKESFAGLNACG